APGLPRLESCTFTGDYPLARIDFQDSDLPVSVSLEAFTPFIPRDADESGLPVAVLRYRVFNRAKTKATVSIAYSIDNPVGGTGRTNDYREGTLPGLFMRNPFLAASDAFAGSFALAVLGQGAGKVSYLRGWSQQRWAWTGALLFWDDFSADGELGPEAAVRDTTGSLCLKREIEAGAEADYTFLLSWHFPNRTPERCGWTAPKGEEKTVIGNHYCSRFADAWKAAEYAAGHLTDLESRTRRFVNTVRESTLPGPVLDAAMSNLSTLVTPTCFRTADGAFHGFEGCGDRSGCCFGTCNHVWNYEVSTAYVFPSLSRSMREAAFGFRTNERGLMDMRELLPFGKEHTKHAAADGQMGQIIKLYLDWRLTGDTEWLRKLWPGAKRALEFAWIPGGWDEDRDGVMEGVQHNTYDVEFYGPNPLCEVWYLGALRAAEEMARAVGDTAFSSECRRPFENGSRWTDANLFQGEYYVQKIQGRPKEKIAEGLTVGMGAADPEHPDYQLGQGCLVDQLVGQFLAGVAGLGPLLDEDKIQRSLRSIYKYNYKRSLYRHEAVQRIFALNDEAGLVICDYASGKRPAVPFPYFGELMTGFEYSAAILMLYHGMVSEGVELIGQIRRRYDGERRSPWDEAECGHHYARAMAAWAAIPALSGFDYTAADGRITFRPLVRQAAFRTFWSTASAWGTFDQKKSAKGSRACLTVIEGTLRCRELELAQGAKTAKVRLSPPDQPLDASVRQSDGRMIVAFSREVELKAGQTVEILA
ncbi:MAG: GH116 family glycosyl-hydrolase, partial [Bryobacteraceae bacterium]